MLSFAKSSTTKVNKCDLCNSCEHVDWLCTNCNRIVCEICKETHSLLGFKYRNHRILRIHGAVEVVVSHSRTQEDISKQTKCIEEKSPTVDHKKTKLKEKEKQKETSEEIDQNKDIKGKKEEDKIEENKEENNKQNVQEDFSDVEDTDRNDYEDMKGRPKLSSTGRHQHVPAARGGKQNGEDKQKERIEEQLTIRLDANMCFDDLKPKKQGNPVMRRLGELPANKGNSTSHEETNSKQTTLLNDFTSKPKTTDVLAHVDDDMNLTYINASNGSVTLSSQEQKEVSKELFPDQTPLQMMQTDTDEVKNTSSSSERTDKERKRVKGIVFSDSKVPTSFVGLTRPSPNDKSATEASTKRSSFSMFNVTILSRHKTSLKWINGLCPCDEESVVYGDVKPNCLVKAILEDDKLVTVSTTEHAVTDVTSLPNGDLLLSYEEGQEIRRVDLEGNVKDILSTAPLCPQGMHVTTNSDILVCLAEKIHAFKFPKCQVQIAQISLNGEKKKVIEFDKKGKKIFSYPHSVIENVNNDICVLDMLPKEKVVLLVFDIDCNFRFKYDGKQHTTSGKCSDFGIVRNDSYGRLLLTDYGSHRIHILSKDGDFLDFLLTEEDQIYYPFAFGITSKNTLWIDCKSNKDKDSCSYVVRVKYTKLLK